MNWLNNLFILIILVSIVSAQERGELNVQQHGTNKKNDKEARLQQYAIHSTARVFEDIASKKCYSILIIPTISGDEGDPFSDGNPVLSSSKIAVINNQADVNFFLNEITLPDKFKTS